ncbi:UDP-N-acetylmuramoyl-L-alanine--D-glutamate ligase [Ilumatobacter sp.]|uniref:UDP-N-acetylmuramoyl-L-alanine--D-glutamate ligase n=1 Tax=Ilumatobacter sp. TaxID=1967498 RepID=UPI003B518C04
MRALVHGLAVAGASTVRALRRHGWEVVVSDDSVTAARAELARQLDVELLERPDLAALGRVVASCDAVCPAPGVPETHPLIGVAGDAGVEIVSEIELAYRWEQDRPGGPRPMLAVTGTDGKTTTTLMAVEMLRAAGVATVDAGNTDTPLVDAIAADDLDAFVVECTSFRLAWTPTFRPDAGAWLNLAPDHLNWHTSMASYAGAKERIWVNQRGDDVAIGSIADAAVVEALGRARARRRTFGEGGDYRTESDGSDTAVLVGPGGAISTVAAMRRSLPHDVTNALAACALVLETGLADARSVERALGSFTGPSHRLEWVGRWDGVDWYDDSKATTPHAAAVAIHAFDPVVLIAGGQDKHVDLAEMAVERERVRAVVAIGETRDAIAAAFDGVAIVETTEHLDVAVERVGEIVRPGDTVLLSPGCASLDQYGSFAERGERFRDLVTELNGAP